MIPAVHPVIDLKESLVIFKDAAERLVKEPRDEDIHDDGLHKEIDVEGLEVTFGNGEGLEEPIGL